MNILISVSPCHSLPPHCWDPVTHIPIPKISCIHTTYPSSPVVVVLLVQSFTNCSGWAHIHTSGTTHILTSSYTCYMYIERKRELDPLIFLGVGCFKIWDFLLLLLIEVLQGLSLVFPTTNDKYHQSTTNLDHHQVNKHHQMPHHNHQPPPKTSRSKLAQSNKSQISSLGNCSQNCT